MKLDIVTFFPEKILELISEQNEKFDLHKINDDIIFFWQPKIGVIKMFEEKGESYENYLENLFSEIPESFMHCYLSEFLDFEEGIEAVYNPNMQKYPDKVLTQLDKENRKGMSWFANYINN
ncbi:hypothetical protein LPB90_18305 [Chryseobacterium sp. LC2016-29]|uniref:hypothetical protein n=1 Tax=Chryseobacterium sp. LC2016-29 TaxID=2897331 RepID=UPI001E28FC01|nr:hypothetical protein [Chryseobacterium sp. LC2016-29]MCD0480395.1 hypothetical protein [Chryseobacterium sp. LC2016-29]